MASRMCGVSSPPASASASDTTMKKMVQVPTTRRAVASSRAPTAWPIIMLAAIEMPNTTPIIRKKTWPALALAVSAASPRMWLTQTVLTEPFSDCMMLEPSTGRAKAISVVPIGPVVRSGPRRRAGVAEGFSLAASKA